MTKKYLADQAQIFKKIQSSIANAVYIFDLNDEAFVWLNPRGEELSGYTSEEVKNMGRRYWLDVMHPDDLPIAIAAIEKAKSLQDGKSVHLEYRIKNKHGEYHWLKDCVSPFSRNEDGKVEAVVGVAIDVNERKSNEEHLRETLEKLNLSLSAAKMGTWEWDLAQNSLIWDERMYLIHGIERNPAVNPIEELARRGDREEMEVINAKVQDAAQKKSEFYVTYRIPHPNGEVHHIRTYGKYRASENGERVYGVAWDSTEEIKTEHEIAEAKARLISSTKMAALGEMSGGIAHEINNPLTVIQARAFQLNQMVELQKLDPEKVKQAAESISRTADKIAKIIRSLKTFAREGTYDPFEVVSVKKIVEETLEFCRTRFYNHGVEIEVDPISADLEVECRIVQIEQVLLNLLNNSFDAVQALENRWIRVSIRELDEDLEIRVSDSGPGIPPDIRGQIMLPFFTTKEVGKGTGLGLSISAGILKSHQGELRLDEKAPNTTFVIHLPKLQQTNS